MRRIAVSVVTAFAIVTGFAALSGPANAEVSISIKVRDGAYDQGVPRRVYTPAAPALIPPLPVGQPSPSRGVVTIAEPPYPGGVESYVEGEEEECLVRKKKLYDPYSGKWLVKTTSICR